jgi:hypothetical protein
MWTKWQHTSYALRGKNIGYITESNFINIMLIIYANMIHLGLLPPGENPIAVNK